MVLLEKREIEDFLVKRNRKSSGREIRRIFLEQKETEGLLEERTKEFLEERETLDLLKARTEGFYGR